LKIKATKRVLKLSNWRKGLYVQTSTILFHACRALAGGFLSKRLFSGLSRSKGALVVGASRRLKPVVRRHEFFFAESFKLRDVVVHYLPNNIEIYCDISRYNAIMQINNSLEKSSNFIFFNKFIR
jgi:hypothetical protein